jgi:hypothetical protein
VTAPPLLGTAVSANVSSLELPQTARQHLSAWHSAPGSEQMVTRPRDGKAQGFPAPVASEFRRLRVINASRTRFNFTSTCYHVSAACPFFPCPIMLVRASFSVMFLARTDTLSKQEAKLDKAELLKKILDGSYTRLSRRIAALYADHS